MADDGFKGTTVTFAAVAITKVTDIGFSKNGNPVDVTSLDDAVEKFVNGIPGMEMTITANSINSIDVNDQGAISIVWNDGTTQAGGANTFVCTSYNQSGSLQDKITTEMTFVPYGG